MSDGNSDLIDRCDRSSAKSTSVFAAERGEQGTTLRDEVPDVIAGKPPVCLNAPKAQHLD
ncbi:protein of unknown function (plasmid) [Caballeronia sp. S22]